MNPQTYGPRTVWSYDLIHYRNTIYNLTQSHYDRIIEPTAAMPIQPALTQEAITQLFTCIGQSAALQLHLSSMQRILNDNTFRQVFDGLLPASYIQPFASSECSAFDFDQRIDNLNTSIRYVDSLGQALLPIAGCTQAMFAPIRTTLNNWSATLVSNRDLIETEVKAINQIVKSNSAEALWLAQSTISADLKSTSTRHVTVDAGLTFIGAYNNKNIYTVIPKLFFGVNYFFKSVDKNTDWKRIPALRRADALESHSLESRYSIWERLCVTGGVTLGAMTNKNFDNAYGSLSFTFGPTYRVNKYVKFSTGLAFLKKADINPLKTSSSVIISNYASLSLDFDLLNAASNVSSLIFK